MSDLKFYLICILCALLTIKYIDLCSLQYNLWLLNYIKKNKYNHLESYNKLNKNCYNIKRYTFIVRFFIFITKKLFKENKLGQ